MRKKLILFIFVFFNFSLFATDIFINNVKIDATQMQNLEM